ncbi:hypothetical protein ACHQM5_027082 [Ranunculus cassubicifolius]
MNFQCYYSHSLPFITSFSIKICLKPHLCKPTSPQGTTLNNLERETNAGNLYMHTLSTASKEDDLFRGINTYRASLNLPALTENKNAECFADEMADQFKSQPCTNTTGSNTVPGTEQTFSNYPDLLKKCGLNLTATKDGMVMPACVPNLTPSLVLTNFTQSQYSGYLNDTKYTGTGIGSEGDWIVVVLSSNTGEGSFAPADNSGGFVTKGLNYYLLSMFMSFFLVYLN